MTASADFKPSVKNCKKRGCGNLIWEIFEGRRRMICAVNDRIPGNLTECPLDAATISIHTPAKGATVRTENEVI